MSVFCSHIILYKSGNHYKRAGASLVLKFMIELVKVEIAVDSASAYKAI